MAGLIRVNTPALRDGAARLRMIKEVLEGNNAKLGMAKNKLDAAWDGNASIEAKNELEDNRKMLTNICEELVELSDQLDDIAGAFESLDGAVGAISAVIRRIAQVITAALCPIVRPFFNLRVSEPLRIIPEEVRAVAADCKQVAAEVQEQADRIRATVDGLGGDWEGRLYSRFSSDANDLANALNKLAENIVQFANSTQNAANAYEEMDAMLG